MFRNGIHTPNKLNNNNKSSIDKETNDNSKKTKANTDDVVKRIKVFHKKTQFRKKIITDAGVRHVVIISSIAAPSLCRNSIHATS